MDRGAWRLQSKELNTTQQINNNNKFENLTLKKGNNLTYLMSYSWLEHGVESLYFINVPASFWIQKNFFLSLNNILYPFKKKKGLASFSFDMYLLFCCISSINYNKIDSW